MSPSLLQSKLAALADLGSKDLGLRWEEAFRSAPPTACRSALLRRALAWHLQASALGRVNLDRLLKIAPTVKTMPGTRLVREWQGRTHQVTVLPAGRFDFEGRSYRSLSAIAREITGTRWSGPAFFGLR